MGGGRVDGKGGRLPSGWVHCILIGIDGLGVVTFADTLRLLA